MVAQEMSPVHPPTPLSPRLNDGVIRLRKGLTFILSLIVVLYARFLQYLGQYKMPAPLLMEVVYKYFFHEEFQDHHSKLGPQTLISFLDKLTMPGCHHPTKDFIMFYFIRCPSVLSVSVANASSKLPFVPRV